ncbi:MAG TPA: SPOR domain-containing protein [Dissulfurispiraceae bacterium]|nr:SPOR domain-containing protein [Dissulfurispiraceae bacterium]
MTEQGSESSSSSFVIVSRKVLIAGIVGISILSFGIGYLLGYGGTSANKLVKLVEADNKAIPSEERTVLDASGKPTMVPPPAMPGTVPKEPPLKPKPEGPVRETPAETSRLVQNMPESADRQKKPAEPIPDRKEDKALKQDTVASDKKSRVQPASENEESPKPRNKRVAAVAKTKKPVETTDTKSDRKKPAVAKKSAASSGKTGGKKVYELQAGAFEDKAKAERLRVDLSSKGYKSHIALHTTGSGKTFLRVRVGPYDSKSAAEEALSALREQGVEGIIMFGLR